MSKLDILTIILLSAFAISLFVFGVSHESEIDVLKKENLRLENKIMTIKLTILRQESLALHLEKQ